MLTADVAYLAKDPLAVFGQVQCILPAIISVRLAFDEPLLFERIQDGYQTAGMDAEPRGELLLAQTTRGGQQAQDPRVRRRQVEARDSLAESQGCMRAYLGQQEALLSVPEVAASLVAVRALYLLTFLFGGAGFAVAFGLLAGGVSVTGYFARLLPRWLVVLGLIVAVAGEVSSLSLIAFPANIAIPVTRFVGFAWIILAGACLGKKQPVMSS